MFNIFVKRYSIIKCMAMDGAVWNIRVLSRDGSAVWHKKNFFEFEGHGTMCHDVAQCTWFETAFDWPWNRPGLQPTEAETNRPGLQPSEPETNRPGLEPSEPETNRPGLEQSEPETNRPGLEPSEPETNRPGLEPPEPETNRPGLEPSEPET